MNIVAKMQQIGSIARTSEHPVPLLLDLMRLKRTGYLAECKGLKFELSAGCFEWFTLFENVIREDYFDPAIEIRAGDVVIDIGANFGSFSVLASRKVGPAGRVIAFEPDPRVFERLVRNVAINKLGNVTVNNEAVAAAEGVMQLYVHDRSAFTTLAPDVDGRISADARTVRVRTRTLASVIDGLDAEIGLLKIDCEGSEYGILDALDARTASRIRQITMEVHEIEGRQMSEVPARLRALGFHVTARLPMVTAVRAVR